MSEENQSTQDAPIAGIGTMVFGKWDATEVTCSDPGLAPYINLTTIGTPHSGGRHANSWFGKAKLSVVERFINNLMRTGQFSGKKQHCAKAFEIALDAICAPKAVDSSPSRRLDIALRNLGIGCASATAKSKKTLTEGIISELSKAASGDVGSFAVGKRDEVERIASSAR